MPYKSNKRRINIIKKQSLQVQKDSKQSIISGNHIRITFTAKGELTSFKYNNKDLLVSGIRLNLYRAVTDNDGSKFHSQDPRKVMKKWIDYGLDKPVFKTEKLSIKKSANGSVNVNIVQNVKLGKLVKGVIHEQEYIISTDEVVYVRNRIKFHKTLDDLPRIGVTMTVRPGFENFQWFGRGPHESYIDRKAGARVGLYTSTVAEQYVPYIMPQEHGNKTDVRWLALYNKSNTGFLIAADELMECSASHFTIDDLLKAFHTNELVPRKEIILNLDLHQRGIGTASCGPDTLEKYRIPSGTYELNFKIQPFSMSKEKPENLARII